MRAAFAVVVADPGTALPQHVDQVCTSPMPAGLGFRASAHLRWHSADGRTCLAAWQDRDVSERASWSLGPSGVAVVCGHPRRASKPWRPAGEWPSLIQSLQYKAGRPTPDDLVGLFVGACVEPDGHGIVVTDPLSLRFLYRTRGSTWTVVASNPHLAAWMGAEAGRRPERDGLGVCSLAATGHRLLQYVGYVGVELLDPGTYVVLESGRAPTLVERRANWWPTAREAGAASADLIEQASTAIAENVRAALTFPAELVVADLTGGKDSRLTLAGAMSAGVARELFFFTKGPADLPDQRVARELAERFELAHGGWAELGERLRPFGVDPRALTGSPEPWETQATTYTSATAGMDNIWPGVPMEPETPTLELGGLFGEALRSSLGAPLPTEAHLVDWFDRKTSRLCLLRPESRARFREALTASLLDDPTDGQASLEDLHDWYVLRTRIRRNFGPREELRAYDRALPSYSLDALRAAFALGSQARRAQALHRGVTARASTALADHRYVDGGWPEPSMEPLRIRRPRTKPPAEFPHRRPVTIDAADGYGRLIVARQEAQRMALLRDLAADRNNPAWDHVDRRLLISLVDQYPSMTGAQQLELMGAATAALWLGDR